MFTYVCTHVIAIQIKVRLRLRCVAFHIVYPPHNHIKKNSSCVCLLCFFKKAIPRSILCTASLCELYVAGLYETSTEIGRMYIENV